METMGSLYKQHSSAKGYSQVYARHVAMLLEGLDHEAVADIIGLFAVAHDQKKRIYFIGNGGSAATCGHFVNDLHAGSLRHGGGGFRVQDLAGNVASLTALANDVGFEHVFSKQLEGVLDAGDIVVAISASGNSRNLVAAVEYARTQSAVTIGFLGFDGGTLAPLCDHSVIVSTEKGEYGPVEDVHMVLDHLISSYFCFNRNAARNGGV
ncbi:MAG: SIS domain-containing protein [Candidatus Omnitrophica bacterium]|nr:SIS domain-containing protein [Candidatus Omnitrophota bacterium]